MKIDIQDEEFFKKEKKYHLSKSLKKGLIIGGLIAGTILTTSACKSNDEDVAGIATSTDAMIEEENKYIKATLDEVNNLNIIINDCDCSNSFFDAVCDNLESDGINFTKTNNCENIDVDNSTIITLDMLYSSGPSTLVLGSFSNERLGNSDALSLSMNAALYENGFFTDEIYCGKIGYRPTDNGGVTERVATSTEEAIGSDKSTSFTTISFGTQNVNVDFTVRAIESGLTRYASYINNNDLGEDLLYRSTSSDTLNGLAEKFGTNASDLNKVNDRDYSETRLQKDESIVNPIVNKIDEFDSKVPIDLSVTKTIWSK